MRAVEVCCAGFVVAACGGRPAVSPVPAPPVRFEVLGNASPTDSGPPTLRIDSQVVTIRGMEVKVDGVGLYADADLSEPHVLRVTLYDSLPGRPMDDPLPPPPPSHLRRVIYEARIGPVPPGSYDVWIGRFDARARLIEVAHAPLHIEVKRVPRAPPRSGDGR